MGLVAAIQPIEYPDRGEHEAARAKHYRQIVIDAHQNPHQVRAHFHLWHFVH